MAGPIPRDEPGSIVRARPDNTSPASTRAT